MTMRRKDEFKRPGLLIGSGQRSVCLRGASGMSLVGLLVGIGVAGILALGIMRLTHRWTASSKTVRLRSDLTDIRENLLNNFDCAQSLGNPPTLPVTCASVPSPLPILNRAGLPLIGTDGKVGEWTIRGVCQGGGIIFQAHRPGNDPTTHVPWDQSPSLIDTNGQPDLFRGTSNFCASFFQNATLRTCPPNTVLTNIDFSSKMPVCTTSYRFGGMYGVRLTKLTSDGSLLDTACLYKNTLTNACSCPAGYTAQMSNGFARTCGWPGGGPLLAKPEYWSNCTYYFSENPGVWGHTYSFYNYICVK